MGTTFSGNSNGCCATCSNWEGERKASGGPFVIAETYGTCSVAAIKSTKFMNGQQTCTARAGQDLYQLWGPLRR